VIRPKTVQTTNADTRRLQDSVSEAFSQLQTKNPILNGVYVEQEIGTGDTEVSHGLQRQPTGFLVVRRDADANVWESGTANGRPSDKLILKATTGVNVTLYVF
jgi:hypothetical protein